MPNLTQRSAITVSALVLLFFPVVSSANNAPLRTGSVNGVSAEGNTRWSNQLSDLALVPKPTPETGPKCSPVRRCPS
jgi:hypothetical protein